MKAYRYLLNALVIGSSIWMCGGCAHNAESVTTTSANPPPKTYDSQDLARTGKRTSGEAVQAADPSVTATTGR
jgi:hypothetical protein